MRAVHARASFLVSASQHQVVASVLSWPDSGTTSSLNPALISRLSNHRALRRRLRRRGGWRQRQHYTSGGAALDLGENTVVDAGGGIGVAADDHAPFVDSIERSKRRARIIIDYETLQRIEENAVRRARCVGIAAYHHIQVVSELLVVPAGCIEVQDLS